MIEFNPINVAGNRLRRHWLVSFNRNGKTCFFADSKRPGNIAGLYSDVEEFILDYERYRGRKIVAFGEVDSYEKHRRSQTPKVRPSERP